MSAISALDIKLDKPDIYGIYSLAFCWKKHDESGFEGLMTVWKD